MARTLREELIQPAPLAVQDAQGWEEYYHRHEPLPVRSLRSGLQGLDASFQNTSAAFNRAVGFDKTAQRREAAADLSRARATGMRGEVPTLDNAESLKDYGAIATNWIFENAPLMAATAPLAMGGAAVKGAQAVRAVQQGAKAASQAARAGQKAAIRDAAMRGTARPSALATPGAYGRVAHRNALEQGAGKIAKAKYWGGVAGASIPYASTTIGETYDRIRNDPEATGTPQQQALGAIAGGAAQAGLGVSVLGNTVGRMLRRAPVGATVLGAALGEGVTEAGESVISRGTHSLFNENVNLFDASARREYWESLLAGAVVGGAYSAPYAAARGVESISERVRAKLALERAKAQGDSAPVRAPVIETPMPASAQDPGPDPYAAVVNAPSHQFANDMHMILGDAEQNTTDPEELAQIKAARRFYAQQVLRTREKSPQEQAAADWVMRNQQIATADLRGETPDPQLFQQLQIEHQGQSLQLPKSIYDRGMALTETNAQGETKTVPIGDTLIREFIQQNPFDFASPQKLDKLFALAHHSKLMATSPRSYVGFTFNPLTANTAEQGKQPAFEETDVRLFDLNDSDPAKATANVQEVRNFMVRAEAGKLAMDPAFRALDDTALMGLANERIDEQMGEFLDDTYRRNVRAGKIVERTRQNAKPLPFADHYGLDTAFVDIDTGATHGENKTPHEAQWKFAHASLINHFQKQGKQLIALGKYQALFGTPEQAKRVFDDQGIDYFAKQRPDGVTEYIPTSESAVKRLVTLNREGYEFDSFSTRDAEGNSYETFSDDDISGLAMITRDAPPGGIMQGTMRRRMIDKDTGEVVYVDSKGKLIHQALRVRGEDKVWREEQPMYNRDYQLQNKDGVKRNLVEDESNPEIRWWGLKEESDSVADSISMQMLLSTTGNKAEIIDDYTKALKEGSAKAFLKKWQRTLYDAGIDPGQFLSAPEFQQGLKQFKTAGDRAYVMGSQLVPKAEGTAQEFKQQLSGRVLSYLQGKGKGVWENEANRPYREAAIQQLEAEGKPLTPDMITSRMATNHVEEMAKRFGIGDSAPPGAYLMPETIKRIEKKSGQKLIPGVSMVMVAREPALPDASGMRGYLYLGEAMFDTRHQSSVHKKAASKRGAVVNPTEAAVLEAMGMDFDGDTVVVFSPNEKFQHWVYETPAGEGSKKYMAAEKRMFDFLGEQGELTPEQVAEKRKRWEALPDPFYTSISAAWDGFYTRINDVIPMGNKLHEAEQMTRLWAAEIAAIAQATISDQKKSAKKALAMLSWDNMKAVVAEVREQRLMTTSLFEANRATAFEQLSRRAASLQGEAKDLGQQLITDLQTFADTRDAYADQYARTGSTFMEDGQFTPEYRAAMDASKALRQTLQKIRKLKSAPPGLAGMKSVVEKEYLTTASFMTEAMNELWRSDRIDIRAATKEPALRIISGREIDLARELETDALKDNPKLAFILRRMVGSSKARTSWTLLEHELLKQDQLTPQDKQKLDDAQRRIAHAERQLINDGFLAIRALEGRPLPPTLASFLEDTSAKATIAATRSAGTTWALRAARFEQLRRFALERLRTPQSDTEAALARRILAYGDLNTMMGDLLGSEKLDMPTHIIMAAREESRAQNRTEEEQASIEQLMRKAAAENQRLAALENSQREQTGNWGELSFEEKQAYFKKSPERQTLLDKVKLLHQLGAVTTADIIGWGPGAAMLAELNAEEVASFAKTPDGYRRYEASFARKPLSKQGTFDPNTDSGVYNEQTKQWEALPNDTVPRGDFRTALTRMSPDEFLRSGMLVLVSEATGQTYQLKVLPLYRGVVYRAIFDNAEGADPVQLKFRLTEAISKKGGTQKASANSERLHLEIATHDVQQEADARQYPSHPPQNPATLADLTVGLPEPTKENKQAFNAEVRLRLKELVKDWVAPLGFDVMPPDIVILENPTEAQGFKKGYQAFYRESQKAIYIRASAMLDLVDSPQNAAMAIELVAHEVGHYVFWRIMEQATPEEMKALQDAHQAWLRRSGVDTRGWSRVSVMASRMMPRSKVHVLRKDAQKATEQGHFGFVSSTYATSLHEFMADMIGRDLMGQSIQGKTPALERLIRRAATALRRIYTAIAKTLGWAHSDKAVADYMQQLRDKAAARRAADFSSEQNSNEVGSYEDYFTGPPPDLGVDIEGPPLEGEWEPPPAPPPEDLGADKNADLTRELDRIAELPTKEALKAVRALVKTLRPAHNTHIETLKKGFPPFFMVLRKAMRRQSGVDPDTSVRTEDEVWEGVYRFLYYRLRPSFTALEKRIGNLENYSSLRHDDYSDGPVLEDPIASAASVLAAIQEAIDVINPPEQGSLFKQKLPRQPKASNQDKQGQEPERPPWMTEEEWKAEQGKGITPGTLDSDKAPTREELREWYATGNANGRLNPVGAAKAMFVYLKKNVPKATLVRLRAAASSPEMQRRIKALLVNDLKAQQAVTHNDSIAAGYMVVMMRAGLLESGPQTTSIVKGLRLGMRDFAERMRGFEGYDAYLREVIGVISEAPRFGTQDFRAFSGPQAKKLHQRVIDNLAAGTRWAVRKGYDPLFSFIDDRIAKTRQPTLIRIGRMLFKPHHNTSGHLPGLLENVRMRLEEMMGQANEYVKDFISDKAFTDELAKVGVMRGQQDSVDKLQFSGTPEEQARKRQAMANLDKLWAYVADYTNEAKLGMGIRKNYFPRIWDRDETASRSRELTDLLKADNYQPSWQSYMDAMIEEGSYEGNATVEDFINWWVAHLSEEGVQRLRLNEAHKPAHRFINPRATDFLIELGTPEQREQLASFYETNLAQIISRYTHGAAKRGEFSKLFGARGERLKDLLTKAANEGASREDVRFVIDAVDMMQGMYGSNTKVSINEMVEAAPLPQKVKDVLIDKSGGTTHKGVRDVTSWAGVYEIWRILPLSALASTMDPFGGGVRMGPAPLVHAYHQQFQRIFRQMDPAKLDALRKALTYLGTVERAATHQILQQEIHNLHMPKLARKLAEAFFIANGVEYITRGSRSMATHMAHPFIIEQAKKAKNGDTAAKKQMNDLNISPDDVITHDQFDDILKILSPEERLQYREQGKKDELARDDRIRAAINELVNSSTIRPGPDLRSSSANDPHFGAVWFIRSFQLMFHRTFISRVGEEALHNKNITPLIMMVGMFVPVMLVADWLRDWIKYGEEGARWKQHWDFSDHVEYALTRAGIHPLAYGKYELMADVIDPVAEGDFTHALAEAAGVSATHFEKVMEKGLTERELPLYGLWGHWFD